jgi:hypothetical protein
MLEDNCSEFMVKLLKKEADVCLVCAKLKFQRFWLIRVYEKLSTDNHVTTGADTDEDELRLVLWFEQGFA